MYLNYLFHYILRFVLIFSLFKFFFFYFLYIRFYFFSLLFFIFCFFPFSYPVFLFFSFIVFFFWSFFFFSFFCFLTVSISAHFYFFRIFINWFFGFYFFFFFFFFVSFFTFLFLFHFCSYLISLLFSSLTISFTVLTFSSSYFLTYVSDYSLIFITFLFLSSHNLPLIFPPEPYVGSPITRKSLTYPPQHLHSTLTPHTPPPPSSLGDHRAPSRVCSVHYGPNVPLARLTSTFANYKVFLGVFTEMWGAIGRKPNHGCFLSLWYAVIGSPLAS